ncbi:class I SAM-dependent methyltransferase [Rhodococcus sp. NPDC003318]|uniref:class I SAM-dependent methyltransferase n=1 Tax=Rhodococcus sp. NPDC003318 TaxID=3364503 RepID=UPI00369B7244
MDAQDWDRRYAGDELLFGAAPEPAVVEFVTSLPAGRALDLGCGEGRNALWLALHAWQVVGVDFSTAALAKAVRAASPLPRATRERLTWVDADVTQIRPGPDYDLVLACRLGLSRESRTSVLRRAAAALRPGGTMLILEPGARAETTGGGESDCTPESLTSGLDDLLELVAVRSEDVRDPHLPGDPAHPNGRSNTLVVGIRPYLGSELNRE